MKFLSMILIALYASIALANQAQEVQLKYNSTTVYQAGSASAVNANPYTQLVASTSKGVTALSVSNNGSFPVGIAYGASGNESIQLIVPAISTLTPVVYPVHFGYGTRLSVISLGGYAGNGANSVSGELDMNVIF